MQTKDMTNGSPAGLILRFALPLMLGNVFQQFYTFVDTMVVGQALGVKALAALGAAEWLTFLMFGLVQGLVQGFSLVMARQFGAGDDKGLKKQWQERSGSAWARRFCLQRLGSLCSGPFCCCFVRQRKL